MVEYVGCGATSVWDELQGWGVTFAQDVFEQVWQN